MLEQAKWIWAEGNRTPDDWVRFRRTFALERVPARATIQIASETKYELWVNGTLAVFDGGLFRESAPGEGYFDELDLAKFLRSGKNELFFLVWYFGNGGRNVTSAGAAGLLFASDDLQLFSDRETRVSRDPAHFVTEEKPSGLYGGHNIGYDANREGDEYLTACEYGAYPCAPWNACRPRPIPLVRFQEPVCALYEKLCDCGNKDDAGQAAEAFCGCKGGSTQTVYRVKLPYAMQFTPFFRVRAKGGERIRVQSDRFATNGGPGDEKNSYHCHHTEYICKPGDQESESFDWLFGEAALFAADPGVEIVKLGYRESCYDADFTSSFETSDPMLTALMQKCARTLKVCMRDNFMDCPDRERGQWIGDVSVQAPQVFFALDERAVPLLKKAVTDFITLRKGDVLVGNVPGDNFSELPAQSLNAISELGMIATYFEQTGDKETLRLAFEPCARYLMLWELGADGLLASRQGNWYWFDHLLNNDARVMENAWYYSAVKFAKRMAEVLGDSRFDDFLSERQRTIAANFDAAFWNGTFYSSDGIHADDRANALCVLSGLCAEDKYDSVKNVFFSVFNATTFMEYYVLEAMCKIGCREQAYRRMMSRYYPLIVNENSTLWEDFYVLGTRNHAWSGGPLTIVFKYFKELLK